MGRIQSLDSDLVNKIAAGEVVESSHSVIKELVENSLDAGANEISIETEIGGMKKILIRDNGHGILKEDLPLVIERYATSKIRDAIDLDNLTSFGFRGEAVASIASVARLRVLSGVEGDRFAYEMEVENGKILQLKEVPHFQGTIFEVQDLFFNTPVRRKYSKSPESEDRKIKSRIQISSLTSPYVSFRYIQNSKEILRVSPSNLEERIIDVFGENIRNHLIPVSNEKNGIRVTGYISDPNFYRSNRMGQFFFVNSRPIEIKNTSYLLRKTYGDLLPSGSHPWCFLYFQLPTDRIDVNVHPQKKEIRFMEEDFFTGFFLSSIQNVLRSSTPVSFLELKRRLSSPRFPGYDSNPKINPDSNWNLQSPHSTISNSSQDQENLDRSIFPNPMKRDGFNLQSTGPGIHLTDLNPHPSKHLEFLPKKHYGILFETFILAEADDGLYIIDQHTAHERIRYEEVLNKLQTKSYGTQPLLTPIRIDLSIDEASDIITKQEQLLELGIEIEDFGGGSILVRNVPVYFEPGREKEIIMDFMNRILHPDFTEPELYDSMAKCVACRTSIRKGSQLSDELISEILNRLSYTKSPSRCPHGRPTLVKLSRDDLEKMFHRK